jgi:hypothetical protein
VLGHLVAARFNIYIFGAIFSKYPGMSKAKAMGVKGTYLKIKCISRSQNF